MKRNSLFNGFTLVEILFALAILGVGLVSILSLFVVGMNSVRQTVALTEATFVAQMVMEDYKRQGHVDPGNLSFPDLSEYPEYKDYDVVPNIASMGDATNLYKIDLTVKHNNKDIANFTTYITKYEP